MDAILAQVRLARSHAHNNQDWVVAGVECGCYYCQQTFDGSEVQEWVDLGGTTALCPRCGIDSVVPGMTNPAILKLAHQRWFRI